MEFEQLEHLTDEWLIADCLTVQFERLTEWLTSSNQTISYFKYVYKTKVQILNTHDNITWIKQLHTE